MPHSMLVGELINVRAVNYKQAKGLEKKATMAW